MYTVYVYMYIYVCMECSIGTIDDSEISTEILGVILNVASFDATDLLYLMSVNNQYHQ